MIRRIEPITNLAIVGISVVDPGGGGIEEFGRRVYHNLPMSAQFREPLTLETAAVQLVQRLCGEARLVVKRVPLINLSPSLDRSLRDSETGSRIQNGSDVSSALALASDWLESGDEEVVLLVEAQEDPAVVCALLVAESKSARDNARPVYALVTGAAEAQGPLSAAAVSGALQEARRASGIRPESIGLIQAATLFGMDCRAEETAGLQDAFDEQQPLTCALGAGLDGLLGVVKTIWCLSRRVIPGVSGWTGPVQPNAWQHSPFYVPAESRPWFIPARLGKRYAGLNLLTTNGCFTHILLCDATSSGPLRLEAPKQEALHLFPLAASSVGQLLNKMTALKSELEAGSSPAMAVQETYRQYLLEKPAAEYVACLLGQTPDELLREIGFALKGIPDAFEKQSDWQTPLGSSFTPRPLGKTGKVSFVYPGAFNSYLGLGRDLFYLFPNLYDLLSKLTVDIGDLMNERLLYPRSMAALSFVDLAAVEAQLTSDPITMLLSGSCLAVLYTDVLRNVFDIRPASAFGYSLGEISMMFASRVWTGADGASKTLRESPLFRTRLAGPQNAVREYWNLPTRSESDLHEVLWENYLLMTGAEKVKEVLPDEPRVYLTHINTPRQVAVGGDPAACRRIIARLKCKSVQAPFNYAIHCEPIRSEYDMLTELHSFPVMGQPDMTLYSAATYQPMPIDRKSIAQQIAHELCHCLDFPRLTQAAYDDGARIFVELGAGGNCARWIHETLQGQPHAAYAINRKGVDDHVSILRLMARMVSQHVPVNLSVLYQD